MDTTDWIAGLALLVAGGALALEIRRWFESGPRLLLSVMADAVHVPADDGRPKYAITIVNRGNAPTTLTHMVAFGYKSRFHKWARRKAYFTAIVPKNEIPQEVGAFRNWILVGRYDDRLTEMRKKGQLYVGVIATHRTRPILAWVRPPSKLVAPTDTISDG